MGPKRWRLGIRPQLTIIVLMAAVLSTVATLFVTESAVLSYVTRQAEAQEQQHMSIANLVLQTGYGQNISISSDTSAPCTFKTSGGIQHGCLTADSPGANQNFATYDPNAPYGKYRLNGATPSGDTDYVDQVQHYVLGEVSVYQCADEAGIALKSPQDGNPCVQISTTFRTKNSDPSSPRDTGHGLDPLVAQRLGLRVDPTTHKWANGWNRDGWITDSPITIQHTQYLADFAPILNPQSDLIGVLFVGVQYDQVTSVVANTTIELVIIGTVIMVAGVILALVVASTIVGTLQRAARQVSGASERFGAIAAQQASGSTQQVWAINAINQALQSLAETASDISRRSEQLAQMGNQVLQRRAEISPTQIDSLIAYLTRSVRDISVASRQQAATYERMTGAMQAVMEVAEQVAGDSQQTTEHAERLELVVQQLRQLVGVGARARLTSTLAATDVGAGASGIGRTVRAVRPQRGGKSGRLGSQPEMAGVGAGGTSGGMTDAAIARGAISGRRGARPASDTNMGGMGAMGAMGAMGGMGMPGQGMLVAGGNSQGARQQMQPGGWAMPNGGFGGSGMTSLGAPQPPSSLNPQMPGQSNNPMNPMAGAGASGSWSGPGGPNSGPNLGPWGAPGPNSGPNPNPWSTPDPNRGPNSGPNSGPRFGPNSGPSFGANGGRRAQGRPSLSSLPELNDPGNESPFPWDQRG